MTAAAERAPWMNPRILTTLMLVFLAGAATGALSMRLVHHPAPVNAQQNREAVLNRFRTQLDLDGAQVQKLSLLLDDYSQYYESLQEQLDDLRSTGKTRIMQILNPEQRVKFEKMMNDLAPQLTGGKQ
jgi:Spy/CpxP family protein refolding chaperone